LLRQEDQAVNAHQAFASFLTLFRCGLKGLALCRYFCPAVNIPLERILVAGGSGAGWKI